MKGWLPIAWGMMISLALALFVRDGLAQGKGGREAEGWPEAGSLAPDFTMPELNGRQVRLSEFRGRKAVFLNFWASWCPSCREEMPTMEKLYRQFRDRGLEIVAVSVDRDRADVARFVKEHGVTFVVLLDPDFKAAMEYRVTGIPTHYFIDRAGVIRHREVGSKDWSKPETWKALEGLLQGGERR